MRQQQAKRAPAERQHGGFDQHQFQDTSAAGAERTANGDLFSASKSFCEHKIGHVAAGDKQNKSNGAEQDKQLRAQVSQHVVA